VARCLAVLSLLGDDLPPAQGAFQHPKLARLFTFAALLVFGAVTLAWWGFLAWLNLAYDLGDRRVRPQSGACRSKSEKSDFWIFPFSEIGSGAYGTPPTGIGGWWSDAPAPVTLKATRELWPSGLWDELPECSGSVHLRETLLHVNAC
jgi:hypothetical protein